MSHAQTIANRANAAKSTGPITPTGKSAAARNACKHGLHSKQIVLPSESLTNYKTLLHGYLGRFRPQDRVELELVLREESINDAHDRAFRQLEALRKKSPTTKQSQFFTADAPETPSPSTT